MKTQRHIIIAILLGTLILYGYIYKFIISPIGFSNPTGDLIYFGIVIPIIILITVSFLIRKKVWAEPYFTSKYNYFNEKVRYSKEYNIPKELLLEKVIEITEDSKFKIVNIDNKKFKIFSISLLSHNTFGENLYISFSEKEDHTSMNFCCTTIHGYSSWGRNKKHINKLINQIEESLII
jgi:hypothetical protein